MDLLFDYPHATFANPYIDVLKQIVSNVDGSSTSAFMQLWDEEDNTFTELLSDLIKAVSSKQSIPKSHPFSLIKITQNQVNRGFLQRKFVPLGVLVVAIKKEKLDTYGPFDFPKSSWFKAMHVDEDILDAVSKLNVALYCDRLKYRLGVMGQHNAPNRPLVEEAVKFIETMKPMDLSESIDDDWRHTHYEELEYETEAPPPRATLGVKEEGGGEEEVVVVPDSHVDKDGDHDGNDSSESSISD